MMKSNKKLSQLSFGFFGALTLLFSFAAALSTSNSTVKANALENTVNPSSYDFSDETELTMEEDSLSVKATSATKTSMGESFTFSFSTGGTGFRDSTNTYIVAPTDTTTFSTYYDEFTALTTEEKEEIQEQYDAGEYTTQEFDSYIYSIKYSSAYRDIVIPKTLSRGIFFSFNITQLNTELIENGGASASQIANISSITIPNTVSDVYVDSFPEEGLSDSFVFNVEYSEDEVPEGWAEGWNHGYTVNYDYDYESLSSSKQDAAIAGAQTYGDTDANFIIGYYPSSGTQYPLVMEYKLVGETTTRYYEFSKSTSSSIGSSYDAVGSNLYGFTNILYADVALELDDDDEIDFDSIVIHNIFDATRDSGSWGPDLTNPHYAIPSQGYNKTLSISDFISYEFSGISTFGGYTSVELMVDQTGDDTYASLKSSFYSQFKSNIENGSVYIRYRFTSLNSCSFAAVYDYDDSDVTETVGISTPVSQHILSDNTDNFVSFLFKNSDVGSGFSATTIRQLSLVSFYITIDLFNNSSSSVVARSSYTARFGYVMVMPYSDTASVFDINTMLIILSIIYLIVYAIATVILFFYLKNKYKNDEFRRMKPKSYFTKSILGLVGSIIVILCITFIILRATSFNNAIVVYNPLDPFIIVFAVLSILIVGYFIKYLAVTYKANQDRKRNIKLHLSEDVEDDGTN